MRKFLFYIITNIFVFGLNTQTKAEDVFSDLVDDGQVTQTTPMTDGAGEDAYAEETMSEIRNVSYYDIAGIMLGMTFKDIKNKTLPKNGYTVTEKEMGIPKLIKYNYDFECRESGVIGKDSLKSCIQGKGKKNDTLKVEKIKLVRDEGKEEITVYFTSVFTGNIAYKIVYKNNANEKLGSGDNFEYQRQEKLRSFWAMVISKYEQPNVPPNKWMEFLGDESGPVLEASYGVLVLRDLGLKQTDEIEVKNMAKELFKGEDYYF